MKTNKKSKETAELVKIWNEMLELETELKKLWKQEDVVIKKLERLEKKL